MSCQRFREAIAGHAAGADLSPAAAAHLGSCEACTARLETERRLLADVDAELARTLSLSASPGFVADVVAHVRTKEARPALWQSSATWIGLATAAAVALGVFLRTPGQPLSPVAVPHQLSGTSAAPALPGQQALGVDRLPPVERRQPVVRRWQRSSAPAPVVPHVDEPPVLVQPDQARAIARLKELLIEGRLTGKMLPPVQPHDTAELTVPPLEIPEITVPDVENVARDSGPAAERH